MKLIHCQKKSSQDYFCDPVFRITSPDVITSSDVQIYGGPQRQYTNIYYITAFYILAHKHIHWLCEYIYHYNPPINFRVILLATLRHVVQIAGQLSRNNPRPSRYLSSDCFRRERNIVSTRISTFLFSYLTRKEPN